MNIIHATHETLRFWVVLSFFDQLQRISFDKFRCLVWACISCVRFDLPQVQYRYYTRNLWDSPNLSCDFVLWSFPTYIVCQTPLSGMVLCVRFDLPQLQSEYYARIEVVWFDINKDHIKHNVYNRRQVRKHLYDNTIHVDFEIREYIGRFLADISKTDAQFCCSWMSTKNWRRLNFEQQWCLIERFLQLCVRFDHTHKVWWCNLFSSVTLLVFSLRLFETYKVWPVTLLNYTFIPN